MSKKLEDAYIDAVQECISWHTVAISSKKIIESNRLLATGVAVVYAGQRYIATAAHAVKSEEPDDLLFAGRQMGNIHRVAKNALPERLEAEPAVPRRTLGPLDILRRKFSGKAEDLAVFQVSLPRPQDIGIRFYPFERGCFRTPKAGTRVQLAGFPTESVLTNGAELRMFLNFELCSVAPHRELVTYDPKVHFLMDFAGDRESKEYVTDPKGMSGCGVWILPPLTKEQVFDPTKIELVGIQVSWYRESQLLKATKVSRLAAVLALC